MSTKEKEKYSSDIDVPVLRRLLLFNSNHLWDDVIIQIHKATGFEILQCEQIAMIAHTKGKAIVKSGEYKELIRVESVLKEIGLITKIN